MSDSQQPVINIVRANTLSLFWPVVWAIFVTPVGAIWLSVRVWHNSKALHGKPTAGAKIACGIFMGIWVLSIIFFFNAFSEVVIFFNQPVIEPQSY